MIPLSGAGSVNQLQSQLIGFIKLALLALGEHIVAADHWLIPSVIKTPTSDSKVPGVQALTTG
ncbi:hypothetical protein D3C72_2499960 [compost metagenome]